MKVPGHATNEGGRHILISPDHPVCAECERTYTDALERAADLARRGFETIEIEIWKPDPERPGYLKFDRRRSPREVCADIRAILGDYPEGGEEGISPFPYYSCGNCPDPTSGTVQKRMKYQRYSDDVAHHGPGGDAPCSMHPECKGFKDWADCPWPKEGRTVVFSVRGSSEGDYVHVEQGGELILLSKTFQGRDAAWTFARNVADLLGI